MPLKKKSSARCQAESWFKLSNYDGLFHFSLKQWADQIARRHFLKSALAAGDAQAFLAKEIPWLTLEPLAPWGYGYKAPAVRDALLEDLVRLLREAPLDFAVSTDGLEVQAHGNTETLELKVSDINESIGRFGHLIIDFNVRDQTLKDAFAVWLKERRKAMAESFKPLRNLGEDPELNWARLKLIPYFDLDLWSKWSGYHLTEPDLVDLLLGDVDGSTRSDLRTIRSNAASVVTLTNVHDLIARAQKESKEV